MKKRFLACLLATCLLLYAGTTAASAADAWDVKDVSYDDIDNLVESCVNFTDVAGELQSSSGALSTYAGLLKAQLAGLTDTTSDQYKEVNGELALVNTSLAEIVSTSAILQQSLDGKDTSEEEIQIAAKSLFISYNSLRDQASELGRKLLLFNQNLNNAQQLHDAGYLSDLQMEQTKLQGTTLQASVQTLQTQLTAIKRSFNTMLGRDYSHSLDLHSLPFTELNDISKMKFSDDLEDALSNYSGDTSGSAYQNPDYDAEKGSFAASFRGLYDAVNDKNNLLSVEQQTLDLEQKSYDASQAQYDSGMLSSLGLQNAKDELDTETAKVKAAQTALFSAYEKYQWAIEYGIISGAAS